MSRAGYTEYTTVKGYAYTLHVILFYFVFSSRSLLSKTVFVEQLYRTIVGDRHHHSHLTQNEDAALSTLSALILNNSMVSSMGLDAFRAPDVAAASLCASIDNNEVMLADG